MVKVAKDGSMKEVDYKIWETSTDGFFIGKVATNYDGDFQYAASDKNVWEDVPEEYQGHYMAWDLMQRNSYRKNNPQIYAQIKQLEELSLDRRDMIWNAHDYRRYLIDKYGDDKTFYMAFDLDMMPLPAPPGGFGKATGVRQVKLNPRYGSYSKLTNRQLKSIASHRSQIMKHRQKLKAYIKNPDNFDNQGYLKNAPSQKIRQQIIDSRIKHLNDEIKTFERNIHKILKGN